MKTLKGIKGVRERVAGMNVDGMTECERIRRSFGMTQSEMAKAIGVSAPVYSLQERGKRKMSKEHSERLVYRVSHAGHRVVKEKEKLANDLDANTYKAEKEFQTVEEAIESELEFELHYIQLTEKLFNKILNKYILVGKTVVRAAADTGVCEEQLKRRLDRENLSYIMGDKWETLVK